MDIEITRLENDTSPRAGLTSEQVKTRVSAGQVNKETTLPTKTIKQIIRDNVLTLFNIINFVLAIAVLLVGSPKNVLFMGVVLANLAIGTIQEIRAKKAVDELSIISASKVRCVRDGRIQEILIEEIVVDDIIMLENGNQIPADCIVVEGKCSANESLLTGESNAIEKGVGSTLLSGSFVASGDCLARVDKVGDDKYAASIFNGAKFVKKVNSEIMRSLNNVIKFISIIIAPVSIVLFIQQFSLPDATIQSAVVNTVGAVLGMIPEGLMLLTSTVLAVSIIRLSKYKVLVQELYCIETLARVDVLCLDKTGTITDGGMALEKIVTMDGHEGTEVEAALLALASSLKDRNQTMTAIREKYSGQTSWKQTVLLPFSSEKKYSGASFEGVGTYIMGAPDFVIKNLPQKLQTALDTYSSQSRVLLLAHSKEEIKNNTAPEKLEPVAFLLISDRVRENAKETLGYFTKQGVKLKIISGDNVKTVANVAKQAGFSGHENCIDATTLKTYDQLKEAASTYSIFGRVTPVQKRDLVLALKNDGHTVAMTGDGVNDVLALKEADCSVAMASGSDAARNVSQLVLLNDDFASMPKVVAEGRRSINNIQRSASLFLNKTTYSTILAVIFVFLSMRYPFEPIQLSLISVFTIGIPSFVLALEPNHERIKGHFLRNIIGMALPTALSVVMGVLTVVLFGYFMRLTDSETSTLATVVTAFTALLLIYRVSKPFNWFRALLLTVVSLGVAVSVFYFNWFFEIEPMSIFLFFVAAVVCFATFGFHKSVTLLIAKIEKFVKRIWRVFTVRKYYKTDLKSKKSRSRKKAKKARRAQKVQK